jgi:GcrA cell cycle regulator
LKKTLNQKSPKQLEELDESSCKWPIGHPDEKSFYFCGRSSLKDFSYCKITSFYSLQPKGKKEEVTDKEEVPEFIEKKIKSA